MRVQKIQVLLILLPTAACLLIIVSQNSAKASHDPLDQELQARLQQLGFTGKIESTPDQRLGRAVDRY